jgi:nucleotide-binding universal stress UspA family protein
MTPYRHLLVAVDGSPHAALALEAGVEMAQRDHATITLVSVSPDVADVARWPAAAIDPQQLQTEADDETQRILRAAVDSLPPDLPVKTIFRNGKAGPEIVRLANCGDYDAVLLGARGVGRVGALICSV